MVKRAKSDTVDIGLRLKEAVRAKVERAAKERGVSMNAEIAGRVERSFERQGVIEEVLALAYGPQLASVFAKAHQHGQLTLRRADKDALRDLANKIIDGIPESEK